MDASLFGIGLAEVGWVRGFTGATGFLPHSAHGLVLGASGSAGAPWWPLGLVAMICLVGASGLFSSSETALFSLTHEELRQFRIGRRGERLATRLLSNPDRLLTAILFWNLLVNLTYFATSVALAQQLIQMERHGWAGLFAVASFVGIVLFGEVLPKSVAVAFRRPLAPILSWPLSVAVRLFDPVAPFFQRVTVTLRRAFWPHIGRERALDFEDLEKAVENLRLSHDVIEQERRVLHNILDLSEMTVEEVMRPRGSYVTLSPPIRRVDLQQQVDPQTEYVAISQDGSEDFDHVLVLAELSDVPEQHVEESAEEAVVVPWCAHVAYALQLMRQSFCSAAAVVNEFGETIGLVTENDILDTVLAPDASRAKRLLHREPVVAIAPGRYQVEGITTLRYLAKRLGLSYEPEEDESVTVAGLVSDRLEHLPQVGDECTWQGYRIRVIEVSRRGQIRVELSRAEDDGPQRPSRNDGDQA
ncbi:MAG: HlyC/CorC family transporter [Planctomycetes bacterium]|nr:HlyC/CorC family transporter [Planctomycetota bacterium]